jgi:hypothetical protein
MGGLDSLIELEARRKADLDKQYRAQGIDIAVIDDSGLYGTLSAALWTDEIYMKNVKDMVANVLKKKGSYKIRRLDVIDHGNVRTFQIGGDKIGLENLDEFAGELSKLTGQFTASGFVHLQHCDIGMNRPLLAALAKLWNVSVYAGEGAHRSTIRYQSGKYVRADPNGKVYYDGRPNQDTYQNYIGMWGEEAPMSGSREETSVSFRNSAKESYPEPSDEYLIRTLGRRYAANDVAGPTARARELTKDFQLGVQPKSPLARTLHARLESRKNGDKLSMYFHDHLSTAERTKLLGILKSKL